MSDQGQGVPFVFRWRSQVAGTVRADDENAASTQAASQVKEQGYGASVSPLKIIQPEEQRVAPGQMLEHSGYLLEEVLSREGGRRVGSGRLALQHRLQLRAQV